MLLSYCLHHHASAEKESSAPEREVDIGILEVDAIIPPPLGHASTGNLSGMLLMVRAA